MSSNNELARRVTLQSAAAATGNGTALTVEGFGAAAFQVSGTFVGTITFEGQLDGVNWVTLPVMDTSGARQTTATAAGIFWALTAGLAQVRARVSAYTSGNITCQGIATRDAATIMAAISASVTTDTEFPAAAALADATANPTTTSVAAMDHFYNGATWDRMRGDITNGLDVDVTRVSGTVTVDSELPAAALLGDNTANPTAPAVGSFPHVWDGATWDRLYGDSANGADVDVTRLPSTTNAGATAKTSDYDSGGGTDTVTMFGLAVPAAGGAAAVTGDTANGLDVDVTRVTGTVTVDSELPAAAVLGDNTANPTAPAVGAFPHVWDGATWDRLYGDSTNGADVDVTRLPTGSVAGATVKTADLDSGGGTDTVPIFGVAVAAAGGAVAVTGDVANGIDVDVTRVTGTVTVDTELPAAGALADTTANPTTSVVGGMTHIYNGATWDRARGDVSNGLDVDVTRVTGTVTVDSEMPAAATLGDNTANPTAPAVASFPHVWDSAGSNWDRMPGNSTAGLIVQGAAADGAAAAGAPVSIGGTDSSGNAQRLLVDARGANAPSYKAVANLLAATTITTNATTNNTAVTGFGGYGKCTFLLTISAKTMDMGTTLNIYIQTSPDDGTTWDDVVSFTQVTDAAMGGGTYVAEIVNDANTGFNDRATRNATLATNNRVDSFCDQLRVTTVSAGFSGADTVTIRVQVIAQDT